MFCCARSGAYWASSSLIRGVATSGRSRATAPFLRFERHVATRGPVLPLDHFPKGRYVFRKEKQPCGLGVFYSSSQASCFLPR